nr:MAG TPA: hypothetical protein [Caudoviricetes sp.]
MKILNRVVMAGSIIALPFDIAGALGGDTTSMVWAMLMFIIFLDSVRNELEWRRK